MSKRVELPTGLSLVADVGCEGAGNDLTWHVFTVGVLELVVYGVLRFGIMKRKFYYSFEVGFSVLDGIHPLAKATVFSLVLL